MIATFEQFWVSTRRTSSAAWLHTSSIIRSNRSLPIIPSMPLWPIVSCSTVSTTSAASRCADRLTTTLLVSGSNHPFAPRFFNCNVGLSSVISSISSITVTSSPTDLAAFSAVSRYICVLSAANSVALFLAGVATSLEEKALS